LRIWRVVTQRTQKTGLFVVAIDSDIGAGSQPILNVKVPLAGMVAGAAVLVALGSMVLHGFNDAGLRLASEWVWRFASFVFVAAAIAGAVCRLFSLDPSGAFRRQMIWSFCASYGVFLAVMLLPNTLGGVTHEDLTAGMTIFSLFGGFIVAAMAYAAGSDAVKLVGEPTRRAVMSVAGAFFWLTYALTGLAHLSGPHRPDSFYGISLSLMIFVLLLRFADGFAAKLRTP
jgi:hypothetical protein